MELIKNFIEDVKLCWSSLRGSSSSKVKFKRLDSGETVEFSACFWLLAGFFVSSKRRYIRHGWIQIDADTLAEKTNLIYTLEGSTHLLKMQEDRVVFTPRSGVSKFIYPIRTVPFTSITAIKFDEALISGGVLTFMFSEKDEIFPFVFPGKENTVLAIKIKEHIESVNRQQKTQSGKEKIKVNS